jgi:hypothetical protein
MSHLGNSTAETIVNENILELIYTANSIVSACTGPNCNVANSTQTKIKQQLSLVSQQQFETTLSLLSIPTSSIIAKEIFNAYLDLAASVSSVYNYQCGATINTSTECVTNSSSVKSSQYRLQQLLTIPAINQVNHITIVSILSTIAFVAMLLFLILFLLGLIESLFNVISETPTQQPVIYLYPQYPTNQYIIPQSHESIPLPVSPYQ